jgi:hypothetical protein
MRSKKDDSKSFNLIMYSGMDSHDPVVSSECSSVLRWAKRLE